MNFIDLAVTFSAGTAVVSVFTAISYWEANQKLKRDLDDAAKSNQELLRSLGHAASEKAAYKSAVLQQKDVITALQADAQRAADRLTDRIREKQEVRALLDSAKANLKEQGKRLEATQKKLAYAKSALVRVCNLATPHMAHIGVRMSKAAKRGIEELEAIENVK